jgi:REP element-mobilizing transposase RayT
MARKLRVQYPGAIYHAMSRGDRREAIFTDDHDRQLFLDTLGQTCQKTDWQVHAWCLMRNHFHLVIETPRANLVAGMQWFLGVYTNRFNHRQKEFGHLFSGRYKALLVDGSGSGYLKTVCDYVHLNPARARLLKPKQPLQEYHWTSYPQYLKAPSSRPAWLRVDRVLGEWGIPKDSPAGREQFALRMETRRQAEAQADYDPYKQGWCVGSEEFRQELLAQVSELAGPERQGREIQESAAAKAERLVAEELRDLGWGVGDLEGRRKGDPQKVRIAARLRRETTMTLAWVAEQLHMGAPSHVACLLQRHKKRDANNENNENTLF